MELMLLKPVKYLGEPGDVVNVKKGYAHNFLLPRRLAAVQSADVIKQVEATKKRLATDLANRLSGARTLAETLSATSIHVEAKANEEGHLFGSVTAAIVAAAIAKEGYEIDPSGILLEEPIKDLGIYDVAVKLHPEVSTSVKLYVVMPPPQA